MLRGGDLNCVVKMCRFVSISRTDPSFEARRKAGLGPPGVLPAAPGQPHG